MIERNFVLYVRLDTRAKDLLRLRAAQRRTNLSTYARDLILAGLGEATPDEAFLLASNAQQIEKHTQTTESIAPTS